MKIAICDDEINFVETIYQYLWDEQNCTIDKFFNSEEIWNHYQNGYQYDIIFCDIMMQPLNGIELGRKIRKVDKKVTLVYLTSNLDYAPLGYEVHAFRYLLKPIDKEALLSVMNDIRKENSKERKLLFETSIGSILVPEDSIIYIEAFDKEVQVFYDNDSFYMKKGLSELEDMLAKQQFFRIHRKYLVHLDHVVEYDTTRVTLDCGRTLPISRRRNREFRQAMHAFIKGECLC